MKSISIVNKMVSKKLDINPNTVAAVNTFYWKASREKLMKCEVTTIFWKHLGSITISKYKVYDEIKRLITKIRHVQTLEKYTDETKVKVTNQVKERLKVLLVHRNNLAKDAYDKRISQLNGEGDEELSSDSESDMDEDSMETELVN